MITSLLKYWKEGLIVLAIIVAVWFYKDWKFQKAENIRQTENNRQQRHADSTHFVSQILSADEIKDYLQYQNKDLKQLLQDSNIRENRLQSIISTTYRYTENTQKGYDASGIIEAIKENRDLTVPFSDTTKCMTIKGNVTFKNDSLKVNITEREFKNKNDNVVYWQRREWKLLFFKTRFLGKKEFTGKTFDQCGQSQTIKIEKKP
jgi:hypothetical protein